MRPSHIPHTHLIVLTLTHNPVSSQVLFYCHFPDLLLSPRTSLLKRLYRLPIDYLEQVTTGDASRSALPLRSVHHMAMGVAGMADRVLVNSQFTARVFRETFTRLAQHEPPGVLYPRCARLRD